MIIAGVDLSLSGTGVVILQDKEIAYQNVIKSKPTKSYLDEVKRLRSIINQIPFAQDGQGIELFVIEGLAFMARNTTALVQLAGLNYLLRDQLLDYKIPFIIVSPSTLKKFVVGSGIAGKDQMMLAAYKRWGVTLTNDNLCDAYSLARVGQALLAVEQDLTKPQEEVLKLLRVQMKEPIHG